MADTNDTAATETTEPKRDERGFELAGDWPLNHRLRAEALARAGKEKDPDGLIEPELIADAGDRLKAEEEAARAAEAAIPSLDKMTKAQLEEVAATETVDLSTATNNPERVKLIEAARALKTGA